MQARWNVEHGSGVGRGTHHKRGSGSGGGGGVGGGFSGGQTGRGGGGGGEGEGGGHGEEHRLPRRPKDTKGQFLSKYGLAGAGLFRVAE
jgi:hypothetical protein